MLLRLTLVVAILAGLATLYFLHFPVQEKITTLQTDLDTARTNEQQARDAETKARNAERKAKEELGNVTKQLEERTEALQATMARLTEQENRANQYSEELTNLKGDLNAAREQLAMWNATGVRPEQVQSLKAELTAIETERDALAEENKILARTNDELQRKVDRWLGKEEDPQMRADLKGHVIAVDPRYEFVVLDIGENHGVVENGKLLVGRDGRLIARLRVTRVEPNRSIANVMPGEKYDEVMEGDVVMY